MPKPDMDKIRHVYLDLPKGTFRDELMPALLDYVEALEIVERAARTVTSGMQGCMSNLFGALDDLDGKARTEEM